MTARKTYCVDIRGESHLVKPPFFLYGHSSIAANEWIDLKRSVRITYEVLRGFYIIYALSRMLLEMRKL